MNNVYVIDEDSGNACWYVAESMQEAISFHADATDLDDDTTIRRLDKTEPLWVEFHDEGLKITMTARAWATVRPKGPLAMQD